jgi:tRNA/rRNA methyltransferase
MGMNGSLRIVSSPNVIDDKSYALAKHASDRLDKALHFNSLREALICESGKGLSLAATARVGSAGRPHPTKVREAAAKSVEKLLSEDVSDLFLVFGPESDGLNNDEVALCDEIVTIPAVSEYRSLNLAQASLVFSYEINLCLLDRAEKMAENPEAEIATHHQKERIISHLMLLAEEVGFILPQDPYKMKSKLEGIFARLPRHIPEAKTLHGFIDQAIRSVRKGAPDYKGKFKNKVETESLNGI